MTQEEAQILLKDLCARLPYRAIAHASEINKNGIITAVNIPYNMVNLTVDNGSGKYELVPLFDIKPYLRPMSSMTEEEKKELKEISDEYLDKWMSVNDPSVRCELDAKISSKRAEFYNSHYLDWNGLIEKGLATEAPKDMYKIE